MVHLERTKSVLKFTSSLTAPRVSISRSHLRHNAAILKNHCNQGTMLCAVVKANAYGHDDRLVAAALGDSAVDCFALTTIEEALRVVQFARNKPILTLRPIFNGTDPELIRLAQENDIHCTVCSTTGLEYLNATLDPFSNPLKVHLKVDTGMGRLGCDPKDTPDLLDEIKSNKDLTLTGIYTHFATTDESDLTYTQAQLALFQQVLTQTGLDNDPTVVKHASNSAATLRLPQSQFDMVRCGIGIFGYLNGSIQGQYNLRPALHLEAPLVQVKTIAKGSTCGYGRTFVAPTDMTIGIVPVGYADGYFRHISNSKSPTTAFCRIGTIDTPIIGRISMDRIIIDLTNVLEMEKRQTQISNSQYLPAGRVIRPTEGQAVTIIDNQIDSPCNVQALANLAGTIPYEILTNIGSRIKRVLVD